MPNIVGLFKKSASATTDHDGLLPETAIKVVLSLSATDRLEKEDDDCRRNFLKY